MKPVRTWLTAVALILAAAACSKDSDRNARSTDGNVREDAAVNDALSMNQAGQDVAVAPTSATAFANAVASSDLFEIESAKLAASKAGSAEVKALAQRLRADHERSRVELQAAAAKVNPPVTLVPALDAEKQAMLGQLRAANGADFDRRFIDQQTNVHQKALILLQDYVGNGESQPLKDFASNARMTIQGHFEHLNGIRK